MKNLKLMVVVALASGVLGAAGGVLAAKSKQIVVTQPEDLKFQPLVPNDTEGKGPQISVVFGDLKKKAPVGYLLRVPAGLKSGFHTHTSDDWAVVIKGALNNYGPGAAGKALPPGGTWFQPAKMPHENHCEDGTPCEVFVYMPKGFDFMPAKADAKP